jgi:tetratricopeptide (TPR) repeat protein
MADAGGAMKYFKRALSVARDSADLRAAYNNVGTLLHDMGRYSEALEYLEKALPYFSPYDMEHDELLPTLYTNLSVTYKWLDNYEQAIHYNAEALRVSMKQFGEEHEITAECYNNMGQLYSKMKEHEKSLEALLKSTAIFEKLEGDFDFERATCYNNVAGAYKELAQYPQAEEYYLKSLELRKKVLGENNPRLATVYNNLGVFFRDLKEYDKALEYYEQAVRLWETSAITRKNLIPGYGNLAVIYDRLGRYEEALATFEKGEAVAEELYRWGEPDAMIFLQYVYETLGKLAPTSEAYRQRYDHFMDDKAIVGLVPKGASAPTSQRGMEGVYYILAFGNWNIDSPTSFFQEEEEMSGKPKTVVFLQNGQVREEHFDNMVGCGWRIYRVTPEQKQAIRDSYAKWKAKH